MPYGFRGADGREYSPQQWEVLTNPQFQIQTSQTLIIREVGVMAESDAERLGERDASRLSAVFVLQDTIEYGAMQELAIMFAGYNRELDRSSDQLRMGAAYVRGFVNGLQGKKSRTSMTLEEKLDVLIAANAEAIRKALPKSHRDSVGADRVGDGDSGDTEVGG